MQWISVESIHYVYVRCTALVCPSWIVGVKPDTFVNLLTYKFYRQFTHTLTYTYTDAETWVWEIWSTQQLRAWTQTHKITHRLCFLTVTCVVLVLYFSLSSSIIFLFFLCVYFGASLNIVCIADEKERERQRACNVNASVNVSASLNSWCVFFYLCFVFFPLQWFYSFVGSLYFFLSIGLLIVNKR